MIVGPHVKFFLAHLPLWVKIPIVSVLVVVEIACIISLVLILACTVKLLSTWSIQWNWWCPVCRFNRWCDLRKWKRSQSI